MSNPSLSIHFFILKALISFLTNFNNVPLLCFFIALKKYAQKSKDHQPINLTEEIRKIIFSYDIEYMIKYNVLIIHKSFINNYLLIISPAFLILLIMLDNGRSLHLLSIHIVSFYLLLKINTIELGKLLLKIKKNFFIGRILILFLAFYLFFWYLPQGGGFTGIGNFVSLYKSSILSELTRLFLIFFNYVDANIMNLPRIII